MLAVVMSTIDSNSFIAATTFSFDLLGFRRAKANGNATRENRLRRNTLIGLWVSTALAALFALAFESIVEVWKEFGSVIMPALLAPVGFAFYSHKKQTRLSDSQGVMLILLPALVSTAWIAYRHLSAEGLYPFSEYPFLSEPIFPGLYLSLLLSVIFISNRNLKVSNSNA